MRNFQNTFETLKPLFISAQRTVPLIKRGKVPVDFRPPKISEGNENK